MKTAAAYIRVSTDDQIEYSPDSQLKAIQNYAKANDMILPEEFIFIDEGISGRTAEKRPSFQRMIGTAKLKPKPFDVILLWKFSRFARNREDSIVYKSMLRKQCGIDVISISEAVGEDKTSILMEAIIEAMDEYYSVNLAEEVRRGMNEKFSRGGVVSQPPFGYKMGGGVFVPNENAQFVQMIYNDYLSGMGTRQIAAKLNDMGIRTAKGNLFENRTVEYILTNPVYIGKLRRSQNGRDKLDRFHENKDNTIYVDGRHQSIISQELFDKVQQKRADTKRLYRKHDRQAPVEFMLKGLVRCDNCGATLVMSSNKKYLQCHNYARGTCKVSHSVSVSKITKAVLDKIQEDFQGNFVNINVQPKKSEKSSAPDLSALLEREQKKLLRIREAYEAGVDTLEEYRENKQKVQAQIDALNQKLSLQEPELSPDQKLQQLSQTVSESLEALLSSDSSETLKNLTLRAFVDRIVFIKPRGFIEIFYTV